MRERKKMNEKKFNYDNINKFCDEIVIVIKLQITITGSLLSFIDRRGTQGASIILSTA